MSTAELLVNLAGPAGRAYVEIRCEHGAVAAEVEDDPDGTVTIAAMDHIQFNHKRDNACTCDRLSSSSTAGSRTHPWLTTSGMPGGSTEMASAPRFFNRARGG